MSSDAVYADDVCWGMQDVIKMGGVKKEKHTDGNYCKLLQLTNDK